MCDSCAGCSPAAVPEPAAAAVQLCPPEAVQPGAAAGSPPAVRHCGQAPLPERCCGEVWQPLRAEPGPARVPDCEHGAVPHGAPDPVQRHPQADVQAGQPPAVSGTSQQSFMSCFHNCGLFGCAARLVLLRAATPEQTYTCIGQGWWDFGYIFG